MRCDRTWSDVAFVYEFQSLLGFLMRCDSVYVPTCVPTLCQFQSLLGFLMRCDASRFLATVTVLAGFNPCWVF